MGQIWGTFEALTLFGAPKLRSHNYGMRHTDI